MSGNKTGVTVLGDSVNSPVIQFPGRRFPGVLVQGDSLKSMTDLADEIVERLSRNDYEEVKCIAEELRELLRSRVAIYEEALKVHGVSLPYPSAS